LQAAQIHASARAFFDRVLHAVLADITEKNQGAVGDGRPFDVLILMLSCASSAMHKMSAS
jgi:hypothetical protein